VNRRILGLLLVLGGLLLQPVASPAVEEEVESSQAELASEPWTFEELLSETSHTVVVGGRSLTYKATAGTLLLKDEAGAKKASVFYMAYTLDGVGDPSGRPLTFSFNGGPGSSSVWLHLGLLGPRRVLMSDEGHALPPPYELVDNEHSLLDVTDLVFIDPVTTGYSRAVPDEDPQQFHGVEEDVETVGEFIRLYTSRAGRWASPKFLIGESYGTTRAAGLAGFLQGRHGMYLNGIMLVSSILNFQTARFDVGNDLPYILFLPTYTATAWYHGRLDESLQRDLRSTLDEVEAFALGDYAEALIRGDTLEGHEREEIADRLARYTGLSREYVLQTQLRIQIHRFVKQLRRDERLTVGRLDSRFTGTDRDAAGENYEFDPSYAAIQGPYTATLNDYVRRELGFEIDLPYEILSGRVRPWKFGSYENRYVNVAETLRQAMTRNPSLKVFVANGFYDLATPYFATQYTFDHLGLDPSLRHNISMGYYEAGHMMYIHLPSLRQLKEDLREFVLSALP
jgi:carboxypeptidase C (cathepsin A)